MTHPDVREPHDRRPQDGRTDKSPWNWLLLVPLLVTLVPAALQPATPELFGIPFFYWYQLAVISIGVACTYAVYPRRGGGRPWTTSRPPSWSSSRSLFLAVSALGFFASRWRRAPHLDSLDEWGLGGRSFGGWITWFLIGGDIYTAYTFVAVPGAGVRRRGRRLLRRPVHDRRLPDRLPRPGPAVVGQPRARLRHARRLRPRRAPAPRRSRCSSRSPASSRRCPTSPCSSSASRRCSRPWASPARRRSSSPSPSSRPTPTTPACGRRRSSPSSRTR